MREIGRPAPSPPPPAPLGIIAIVTKSHTAGHCCDMMYLFTKSKQISRCASDMARRWSYRSSEEPGAEFMFLA